MQNREPAESTLRKFFTDTPEMLCIARDGRLHDVNPAWVETLGWSEEELTTRPFLSFIHPDDREKAEQHLIKLAKPHARISYQARFEHSGGGYVNLRWSCFSEGEDVYGVARDVTEFIETRLRAERNEAVAVGVLKTAVDPIVVIDSGGTIVEANDATVKLFGFELDELLGQNVKVLMPEPHRSEHDGYVARYLGGGEPRIIGIGREVQAQRADGSTFPIALAVSEVRTDEDHLFTGIVHDLTERYKQQRQAPRRK